MLEPPTWAGVEPAVEWVEVTTSACFGVVAAAVGAAGVVVVTELLNTSSGSAWPEGAPSFCFCVRVCIKREIK